MNDLIPNPASVKRTGEIRKLIAAMHELPQPLRHLRELSQVLDKSKQNVQNWMDLLLVGRVVSREQIKIRSGHTAYVHSVCADQEAIDLYLRKLEMEHAKPPGEQRKAPIRFPSQSRKGQVRSVEAIEKARQTLLVKEEKRRSPVRKAYTDLPREFFYPAAVSA